MTEVGAEVPTQGTLRRPVAPVILLAALLWFPAGLHSSVPDAGPASSAGPDGGAGATLRSPLDAALGASASPTATPASATPPTPLPLLWPVTPTPEELLPGDGGLLAVLRTSMGAVTCTLDEHSAPRAVANFIALALGRKPWLDPIADAWVARPFFTGRPIVARGSGFVIGFGAATGYAFADEPAVAARHGSAGVLGMQNEGADNNGGQFYVTLAAAPHLDGRHTALGRCGPLPTLQRLAEAAGTAHAPSLLDVECRRQISPARRPAPGSADGSRDRPLHPPPPP